MSKYEIKDFAVAELPEEFKDLKVHDHRVINHIYKLRGIRSEEEVNIDLKDMLNPFTMKGMSDAVELLIKHIKADSTILVVGDFDCDGATGSTIMVEGLRLLGCKKASYLIPDRKAHGYGMQPPLMPVIEEKKADLIVTVDQGITATDAVDQIKSFKYPTDVLITDHHLPGSGQDLPRADAIVNPNQPDCEFESKALAGCGVAFYIMVALRFTMRERGIFKELGMDEPKLEVLLDVLAMGTVADCVALDQNNRRLIKAGLDKMNRGQMRPALMGLAEVCNLQPGSIISSDMGFKFGPRINAVGRMEKMEFGVEFLLNPSISESRDMAIKLNEINEARKNKQHEMTEDMETIIQEFNLNEEYFAIGVVIPDAHEGIMGICAGRGKEKYNRPFVCFAEIEDPTKLKGSGRSVPGVNIRHVFDEINAIDDQIFVKYGGHAMAAGLEIIKDKFNDFQKHFDACVRNYLTSEMIRGDVSADMALKADEINIELCELIDQSGPWGQKFEAPLFYNRFIVEDTLAMGKIDKIHLKVSLKDPETGQVFEGVKFSCIENGVEPVIKGNTVDVSYTLSINEWMGRRSIQLMIKDIQDEEFCLKMQKEEKLLKEIGHSKTDAKESAAILAAEKKLDTDPKANAADSGKKPVAAPTGLMMG